MYGEGFGEGEYVRLRPIVAALILEKFPVGVHQKPVEGEKGPL